MLTEEQKKKYIKFPFDCPFCGSRDLTCRGGETDPEDFHIYRAVQCKTCRKEWDEKFELTGIEEMEEPK